MTRAEKRYGSLIETLDQDVTEAIRSTFDLSSEKLPSRKVITQHVRDPYDNLLSIKSIKDIIKDENKWMSPFVIREMYLEHSFSS